jgi:spermidine synthase
MKPWTTLAKADTADGLLELKQRGPKDFLITIDGRVLMNSVASRSEVALGARACRGLSAVAAPRVLIGGLGMGITLRAALDALPPGARVVVAELNPVVVEWCRGPLAALTDAAVDDPRVTVEPGDVMKVVRRAGQGDRFDAIAIDLYVGPDAGTRAKDPLYGNAALAQYRAALRKGGVFGTWGEAFDAAYAQRLERAGFAVRHEKPGKGGLRHVVYLATAR